MPAFNFMLALTGCVLLAFVLIFALCVAVLTIIKTIQILKQGGPKNGK